MVKDGQEKPEVLTPAQSCRARRAWPFWKLTRFSQPSAPHEPSADCSHPVHPSGQISLPFRGGSPQDGLCPFRQDGRICRETSGVPFPGTSLESGGGGSCAPGQAPERLV